MTTFPRLRVHDAVKLLVLRLEKLNEFFEQEDQEEEHFRGIAMAALGEVRDFLDVVEEESGRKYLTKPLLPLAQALLDYEVTGKTPKMFKGSSSGRAPLTVSERNLRHLCAWLQEIYRHNGLSRTEASSRLRRQIRNKLQEQMDVPTTRTLEAWFDRCQPNGEWRNDYEALFSNPQTDPTQMAPWNLRDLDDFAVELISQNLKNF